MSGGHFDYKQGSLATEMFGWDIQLDYGAEGHLTSKAARAINPMEDREISEIVWDVLCLIQSYDWYASADTSEEDYRADVKWFKDKWFNRTKEKSIKAYKQDIRDFADSIMKEIDGND